MRHWGVFRAEEVMDIGGVSERKEAIEEMRERTRKRIEQELSLRSRPASLPVTEPTQGQLLDAIERRLPEGENT